MIQDIRQQPAEPLRVLRIDASARRTGSVSRRLGDTLVEALRRGHDNLLITRRDLAEQSPPLVDESWVDANFTDALRRNEAQREKLAVSDYLVQELKQADLLVINTPLYNFSVPAALKAWIDLVARARLTFRYTDSGVEGLLRGKRAYVVIATGGVEVGSSFDFASGYLRHVLGFLGIGDVEIIAADGIDRRGDEALEQAKRHIDELIRAGSVTTDTMPNAVPA
jgi:FMN-dependent NADH-azoreductase